MSEKDWISKLARVGVLALILLFLGIVLGSDQAKGEDESEFEAEIDCSSRDSFGGNYYTVTTDGEYLYALHAQGMSIFCITEPTEPEEIGFIRLSDWGRDLVVDGNIVYVSDAWNDLVLIDVADRTNPVQMGRYDVVGGTFGVAVQDNYVFMACEDRSFSDRDDNGLLIINTSNKSDPARVGNFDANFHVSDDVAVSGDVAYLVADMQVHLIDVSSKVNPRRTATYEAENAHALAVQGNYLYVVDYGRKSLVVLNVSDKSNPREVGDCDVGQAWGVEVIGNHAYVMGGNPSLTIVDITIKGNPRVIGGCKIGTARGVAVVGNYLYTTAAGSGLVVVDISDKINPVKAGEHGTCTPNALVVSDGYLYVADGWNGLGGLSIFDVSDPGNPALMGGFSTGAYTSGLDLDQDTLYLASGDEGLVILDISDRKNPWELSRCELPGSTRDVVVKGDYAYLANDVGGFAVVDISNRSNPELLGSYDTDGEVWGVTVVGDLAYVADQDYGLVILDVSNRSDPHKVGEYQTNEFTRGVAVDGNYCYLAEGDAGLLILNITDSKAPVEVSRCETAGYSWSLVCSGDYVFMDKVVVNVADKANPRIVADYNLGDGIDIAVDRDHAYLARRSKGLTVLQLGPVAHIDGIWPAVAYQGQDVLFQGRGSASGIIHEYQWHSDIDGFFGQGDNFSISTFSTGSHNITLKVRDQWGQWSLEAAGSLLIHQRPVAYMDPVSPNLALTQKPLQFRAYALDDGYIQQYVWTSSLDGELHNNSFSNFSSSHLSQGTHTITFKAQDNFGCWSFELADMVILTDRPLASILEMTAIPELGEKAFHFQGSGEDDGFIQRFVWESSLDGEFYNGSMNSLMSESLSPGHHTINFRVQDDHGFWSRNQTKTLTINWDTDRDGIINSQDAFPNDPAASVDKDGDGYPDSWNLGMSQGDSSTGLSLDAYPSDPYLWEDNIEESGTPAFMALALIMAFFLVACVKDRGYF